MKPEFGLLSVGLVAGCVWMVSMALTPLFIGRSIDEILAGDPTGLIAWTCGLLGLAVATALAGMLRHRCDTITGLHTSYRSIREVARHAARLGSRLHTRTATGEVVAVGTTDIYRLGFAVEHLALAVGSVVAIITVAAIMLSISVPLGALILIGSPLLLLATAFLVKPLHSRVDHQRDRQAELTERAKDIISGLRILRGVGGEATFGRLYREDSQGVRRAGVRVAKVTSVLEAAEFLLPGIFIVSVVWVSARLTLLGTITSGDLVAFYAYAAFLVIPMRTILASSKHFVGGFVAAQRMRAILAVPLESGTPEPAVPVDGPDLTALVDADSGVRVSSEKLTAVAPSSPEHGADLAARLGRYARGAVTLGGVPVESLSSDRFREHVLVSDNDAQLFSGMLSEEIGGGRPKNLAEALHSANAEDVVEALPEGLDAQVAEQGRTFSGGQQQRLRLARALAYAPPVLVLVEPTSAVDALTEARIAGRLRKARSGHSTLVITTSPLLLTAADEVLYLEDGKVAARGTHHELLATNPAYAEVVLRREA